ncbi:TPA: DUF2972 domain-containing protein [Campylobacter coli]|nr:DUF2972 domain-containing protein [Campylobacter coli]
MLNPNCAVERVKNHLAYKVGSCVLYNKKKKFSFFILLYKLYKIKSEHYKELKNYQVLIKLFPSLRYPKLEECSNYKECIKVKFHLSYMLGQAILEADKNKFKGGYFRLWQDIKRVNQEYKDIKIFLQQYNLFIERLNNIEIQNIDLLIKNFHNVFYILNFHKDYQEIINVIIDNFDYFLNNFDTIEEWLLSDDFNERYKKENHPYPPLLNPKKLNNKNEKINYHNIPAEVAWEINLPLPDRYKFIILTFGLTGHSAMLHALKSYGVKIQEFSDNYRELYVENLNIRYDCLSLIYFTEDQFIRSVKYLFLLPNVDVLILTRDPISKLKSGLNHGWLKCKDCYVDSEIPIEQMLDRVDYAFYKKNTISMDCLLNKWLDGHIWRYDSIIQYLTSNNILYLDIEDIMPYNINNTFDLLKKRFDFNKTPSKDIQFILFGNYRYIIPLVVKFKLHNITVFIEQKQFMTHNNINLDILLGKKHRLLNDISFSVSKLDYKKISKNNFIIKELSSFQDVFLEKLNYKVIEIEKKKYTESDILEYLRTNSAIRVKMHRLFKKEFNHIKQHRPDIVASWKYYQEFEKMCEKLDKKE